jgi:Fe-S cluster biogenesis protein NfuA
VTCPASTQTLKAGIERIMKDRVEGVTEVLEINAIGMSESAVSL